MLNVIAVMGRLVADPELRKTPNGISTSRFTIACDRSYVKAGGERQTDFFDVVAWRGTAEFVCKYFKKGQMMALDGSLQTHTYDDKEGNKRKAYEIVAGNVNFAESKRSGGSAFEGGGGEAMQTQRAPQEAPAFSAGAPEDFAVVDESEDLPF